MKRRDFLALFGIGSAASLAGVPLGEAKAESVPEQVALQKASDDYFAKALSANDHRPWMTREEIARRGGYEYLEVSLYANEPDRWQDKPRWRNCAHLIEEHEREGWELVTALGGDDFVFRRDNWPRNQWAVLLEQQASYDDVLSRGLKLAKRGIGVLLRRRNGQLWELRDPNVYLKYWIRRIA